MSAADVWYRDAATVRFVLRGAAGAVLAAQEFMARASVRRGGALTLAIQSRSSYPSLAMHRRYFRAYLLLSVLICASLAAASTMFFAREYIVEPVERMSEPEAEAAFRAFRDLLVSKGLKPLDYGGQAESHRVAFRVGGSSAGFEFRQDWEDILELTYAGGKNFRLRLMRITHQPEDFSDEYLKKFVEDTEALIREATAKPVRLKPPPEGLSR